MKQFTLPDGRVILAVEVPKDGVRFSVDGSLIRFTNSCYDKCSQVDNDGTIILPIDSEYEIIGLLNELSEEECAGLVERDRLGYKFYYHKSYKPSIEFNPRLQQAKGSLNSRLQSLGLDPINNNILLLEKK